MGGDLPVQEAHAQPRRRDHPDVAHTAAEPDGEEPLPVPVRPNET